MLLVFISIGTTVALPAADEEVRSTDGALELSAQEEHGMRIYRNEGCWYCHTMAVRSTPVDAIFGETTEASRYAELSPAMLGVERIGPDLSHVGGRLDADAIADLLEDPRAEGRASSMPSYRYLSDADVEALTAFLLANE